MEFQGSCKFKIDSYLPVIDLLISNLEKNAVACEHFFTTQTINNAEIIDSR